MTQVAAVTVDVEACLQPQPFVWQPWALWRRFIFLDVGPLIHHGYKHTLQPEVRRKKHLSIWAAIMHHSDCALPMACLLPQDMYHERSLGTEQLLRGFEPAFARAKDNFKVSPLTLTSPQTGQRPSISSYCGT
jgi:hypothetical protein